MTGMGGDGAAGLGEIKAAGGHTIAQDKDSSAVYGMPRVAIEKGYADKVLPLDDLPSYLSRKVGRLPELENRYVFS